MAAESPLRDRAVGVLVGAAVGDALGGATEGWTPEQIQERYDGFVTGIVPPFNADWRNARPIAPYHKGDGHITDDTLMTHALVEVYDRVRDHLDAYAVADELVPLLMGERRWVPEMEAEALLLQRVFLAEKHLVARVHYGHVDPREAGVGNIVNCGAAMYMAPVGVVNAADPAGAYREAVEVAAPHQSSYGREAAGALAAAVAAAMADGASPASVVEAVLSVARDGTRAAVQAVAEVAADAGDWREAIPLLRKAVEPFDTVGPDYRSPALDARRPSRTKAIEELPVALGMVLVADGDHEAAVLGGTNYGRDADSIASMAGAVCGALGGAGSVRRDWADRIAEASRTPLEPAGATMAEVAAEVMAKDAVRCADLASARAGLLGDGTGGPPAGPGPR